MKYNVTEMTRNEAILEIVKGHDCWEYDTELVDMINTVDRELEDSQTLFKVTIEPVKGYHFEKYFGLEEIKEILPEELINDVFAELANNVEDIFKDKIDRIKSREF